MDIEVATEGIGLALPDFGQFADDVEEPVPDFLSPVLAAAFDQLSIGVAIVTVDGELLYGNKTAIAALRICCIKIDAAMRLVASRSADAAALERAWDAAAGLRRALFVLGEGGKQLTVAIQPLLTGALSRRAIRGNAAVRQAFALRSTALNACARANQASRAESAVLDALCGVCASRVARQMNS
jgi:hypothetical protein